MPAIIMTSKTASTKERSRVLTLTDLVEAIQSLSTQPAQPDADKAWRPEASTFLEEVGWRIWDARIKAGMGTEDVANAIRLGRPSIINIEAGRHSVQLKTLRALARLFNMDYRDFLPEDK